MNMDRHYCVKHNGPKVFISIQEAHEVEYGRRRIKEEATRTVHNRDQMKTIR